MRNYCTTAPRLGQHKKIVLALSIALGLAATTGSAAPDRTTDWQKQTTGPLAALIRSAAEAGIELPADLPKALDRISDPLMKSGGVNPLATGIVTNCNNSGAGSLRSAVAGAASGDIIDMSGLACDVKLTSSIVTSRDNLTIKGNPENKYGISGENNVRPLRHTGTGTLTLDGVVVKFGEVSISTAGTAAEGGCVHSAGSVVVRNRAEVKYCVAEQTSTSGSSAARGGAIFAASNVQVNDGARVAGSSATSTKGGAFGGGIFAGKSVMLSGAVVSGNTAESLDGMIVRGGGVYTPGKLRAKYASISGNTSEGEYASAAGAWVGDSTIGSGTQLPSEIKYSTISGNQADGGGAGLVIGMGTTPGTATIHSSTIANNKSLDSTKYGGAIVLGNTTTISNSTISGNTEKNAGDTKYGAGITIEEGGNLTLKSTIVADNDQLDFASGDPLPSDIGTTRETGTDVILGSHNMIGYHSPSVDIPSDTLGTVLQGGSGLGPLADNGGLTKTMALLPDSRAINKGDANSRTYDQRGEGFPRVVGSRADIGAFEHSGLLFSDGFE